MNERIIRSFLTVMINDQAYLYAMINTLIEQLGYMNKSGPIDEDLFEQWQDEWKAEFVSMVEDLSTEIGIEEFLQGIDEEE